MNILFLTLLDFDNLHQRNIYTDILREFVNENHDVYVISPVERRTNRNTEIIKDNHMQILKLKIGNTQKTNIIEKGISTIRIESQFIASIKKYFSNVKFDLVIYSTPPITLCNAIEFVKKRDGAMSYLLLKDIFPQNAVDMGMISKTGVKSILYKYFRNKEKKLYAISDFIGCMSQANVDYVIRQNPELSPEKVEICPNSVEPIDMSVDKEMRVFIRKKYGIPIDKKVFVYGGNLGKPQGVDFLVKCLESQKDNDNTFYLIVGDGTEFRKLQHYVNNANQKNLMLMNHLPKKDYDKLVGACDVGLIFLDHRFTIPNFPSRLLSYMQAKIPVLAVTDSNTDIGEIIVKGGFGWWCESNDVNVFNRVLNGITGPLKEIGLRGFSYLSDNYSSKKCYEIIMNRVNKCNMESN